MGSITVLCSPSLAGSCVALVFLPTEISFSSPFSDKNFPCVRWTAFQWSPNNCTLAHYIVKRGMCRSEEERNNTHRMIISTPTGRKDSLICYNIIFGSDLSKKKKKNLLWLTLTNSVVLQVKSTFCRGVCKKYFASTPVLWWLWKKAGWWRTVWEKTQIYIECNRESCAVTDLSAWQQSWKCRKMYFRLA